MAIEKVIDIKVQGNVDQAVGSLRSQLKQAQAEVAALSDKFGATSAEAAQAARRAAELKDQIGDAKALTDAFNPDAKFRALTSSLSGVAGGFAAVQGGMALFGAQSEEVEATLLKVQSAMALSQGLQAVGESLDSFKQLGAVIKELNIVKLAFNFIETGQIGLVRANTLAKTQDAAATAALATATVASTAATSTATIGLKLFRLALIGTGIGALVVGLVALYQNFDKVKAAVLNVLPGLTDISKFIGNVVTSVTDFVGATSDASRALDKLKSDADATLALNKRFMQEHGSQVDEYTKKKIQAKNDYLEAIKEDGANVAALGEELNRQLAAIDKEREAKRKEGREKRRKEEEAADKKEKDDRDAAAKKEAEDRDALASKLGQDAEARYDAILKVERDARKANADALLTEQQLAIQNEEAAYKIKYDNAVAAKVSTRELEIEHLNKINDINLTAQQKQYDDDKAISDAKIKLAETEAAAKVALMAKTATVLSQGADLLGKNTAAGKAMAIAAATINTYQGITAELATKTVTPFEIGLKIANVAIIAATGFKAVKDIISVKVPGGGGGSGPTPSMGAIAGGGATAPQFNVVGNTGVNQLAGVIGNKEAAPVQAYVVANNVTTAQSLDRNIIASATLGG